MDVKATLETRQSKTGNMYDVVVLWLSDKSQKLIFLTEAEKELLKLNYSNNHSEDSDFPFTR